MSRLQRLKDLEAEARRRVLILDGAMGTQIQNLNFEEEDFRGYRFANSSIPLKGCNDLLNLTQPEAIRKIHQNYIDAGCDFIETNTFSGTSVALEDYNLQNEAGEISEAGARIAREAADETERVTSRRIGVLGALGPTNKTLSISPKVSDPGYRDISFEEMRAAYFVQARAMQPYLDFFLIETIFDTLNAKAAIKAIYDLREESGVALPVIVSGTITDASGRTLSGQTPEAFWYSVRHVRPWAVGLNCALGASLMRQHIETLSRIVDTRVIAFPNAGLPNEFGEYEETACQTANHLSEWAADGLVNILGGCCGTTPAHIKRTKERVDGKPAREIPVKKLGLRLSGLEPLDLAA